MPNGEARANIGGNITTNTMRNPIARRLMQGFLTAFDELVRIASPRTAFEVGCGEGELLARLQGMGIAVAGCDLDAETVERARLRVPGISVEVADLSTLAPRTKAVDLIVCCEVLEHVSDVNAALSALSGLVTGALLVSVPREPIWRAMNMARGRYWPAFGNTPGHINHWSRGEILELLTTHWSIVETRSPLPWSMALCRRRPRSG
jgi:2-polyprenyl-3-methyl-5-hydroxy-6-metoxy-1,4-benzoquinol methylase